MLTLTLFWHLLLDSTSLISALLTSLSMHYFWYLLLFTYLPLGDSYLIVDTYLFLTLTSLEHMRAAASLDDVVGLTL